MGYILGQISNGISVQMGPLTFITGLFIKELFFAIQPLSQCQNTTVSMIKTSVATTNALSAIL